VQIFKIHNTVLHSAYIFLKSVKNTVKIYVLFLDTAHHYETQNTEMNKKKYHNTAPSGADLASSADSLPILEEVGSRVLTVNKCRHAAKQTWIATI